MEGHGVAATMRFLIVLGQVTDVRVLLLSIGDYCVTPFDSKCSLGGSSFFGLSIKFSNE